MDPVPGLIILLGRPESTQYVELLDREPYSDRVVAQYLRRISTICEEQKIISGVLREESTKRIPREY